MNSQLTWNLFDMIWQIRETKLNNTSVSQLSVNKVTLLSLLDSLIFTLKISFSDLSTQAKSKQLSHNRQIIFTFSYYIWVILIKRVSSMSQALLCVNKNLIQKKTEIHQLGLIPLYHTMYTVQLLTSFSTIHSNTGFVVDLKKEIDANVQL